MSYDIERALITRVIEEDSLKPLIRNKVTAEFFKDEECRDVIQWLLDKYERRRVVPSIKLLQREFPTFEPYESEDDTEVLIESLKQDSLHRHLAKALNDIAECARTSPEEGFAALREKAGILSSMYSGEDDEDITKTIDSVMAEYEYVRYKKGIVGVPWFWPYLNEVTGGREEGTLSAFFARPKSKKTFLSLVDANYVHAQFGHVVGYASCEMPLNMIKRRLAAIRAKVSYRKFRKGRLGPGEFNRFKNALEEIKEAPPFHLFKPKMRGEAAITELRTKVEDYDLDLLWVDGFYCLRAEDTAQGFRVITSGLKHNVAGACKIPVCGTTQANRDFDKEKAKTSNSVSFGDALSQDCDWLMAIIQTPENKDNQELVIDFGVALRESTGGKMTIHAIPCTNFSQKSVEREDDSEEEDEEKPPEDDDLLEGMVDNE